MLRRYVYRCAACGFLSRPVVLVLAVALNLAHPLLHAFEGGGLDAMLVFLDGLAMQAQPEAER